MPRRRGRASGSRSTTHFGMRPRRRWTRARPRCWCSRWSPRPAIPPPRTFGSPRIWMASSDSGRGRGPRHHHHGHAPVVHERGRGSAAGELVIPRRRPEQRERRFAERVGDLSRRVAANIATVPVSRGCRGDDPSCGATSACTPPAMAATPSGRLQGKAGVRRSWWTHKTWAPPTCRARPRAPRPRRSAAEPGVRAHAALVLRAASCGRAARDLRPRRGSGRDAWSSVSRCWQSRIVSGRR